MLDNSGLSQWHSRTLKQSALIHTTNPHKCDATPNSYTQTDRHISQVKNGYKMLCTTKFMSWQQTAHGSIFKWKRQCHLALSLLFTTCMLSYIQRQICIQSARMFTTGVVIPDQLPNCCDLALARVHWTSRVELLLIGRTLALRLFENKLT